MEYHEPAAQWEIFGMSDFESYCEKSVVKGVFHPSVPKDVVDAYEVAEYMMAHAYYHYPLYDEAFSKLLRITEMAVKIRCQHLGIDMKKTILRKGVPTIVDKTFNDLINDLGKKEPSKNIKKGLHGLREMRNSLIHRDRHGFSGSMSYGVIKVGVTVLNKIFISEQMLLSFQSHLKITQTKLSSINRGASIFTNKGYLVERVEVRDALFVKGEWLYLVVIHPVTERIEEQVERNEYKIPEMFVVKELVVGGDSIVMKEVNADNDISIITTKKDANIATHNKFIADRKAAKSKIKRWRINPIGLPTSRHNDFLYEWLWKVGEK